MSNTVDTPPTAAVMDLIFGRWRSQTLYAGVKLGLFEVLADGARSAEEVAGSLGLDPDNTYRLLRALGSLDLLEERPGGSFEITEKGKLLTDDHPRSLRGVVLLEEGPEHYAVWTHLRELVCSGENGAFEEEHGYELFDRAGMELAGHHGAGGGAPMSVAEGRAT